MRFIHVGCGGEIDTKKRMCLKCKKKWNPISFLTTSSEIRPMVDKRGKPVPDRVSPTTPRKKTYASWADKFPLLGRVLRFLPKWPRWARILVVLAFIGLIIVVILILKEVLWLR